MGHIRVFHSPTKGKINHHSHSFILSLNSHVNAYHSSCHVLHYLCQYYLNFKVIKSMLQRKQWMTSNKR
jgi:hypothetical protein